MPPPPPPPPPPGGLGGPPPPPPPAAGLPSRPPKGAGDRSALLSDINKGTRLKKAVTNDRSAPMVGGGVKSSGPPLGAAPPVPGMAKPPAPSGLAPPVPPGQASNRLRSNSDTGSAGDSAAAAPAAPQLGGLFAAGMPKLRSRGGVDTGANRDSPYRSEAEGGQGAAPKPPIASAPKPPGARPPPRPPSTESPPAPVNPQVANLRKPPPRPASRPSSTVSTASAKSAPDIPPPRAPPPPPGAGKAPPPPPTSLRKPSTPAPPPPPPASASPAAPPPPPPAASAPRPPAPTRSTPPPPPPPGGSAPPPPPNGAGASSIAVQAARNALGHSHQTPSAPPPPPPSASAPAAPPPPPPSAPPTAPPAATHSYESPISHHPDRSTLDPSAYTLSNGGSSFGSGLGSAGTHGLVRIDDNRFKFQSEGLLPKPRPFVGGARRYRAGRGSSVPLDLSALSG